MKLALTWTGKDQPPRAPAHVLLEDETLSYRGAPGAFHDNLLIQGDNLPALQALASRHANRVKCVYLDPPYNTGAAFELYDDSAEHATWLSFMRDRLNLIRTLLAPDGFVCCHIDDSEGHYLKVLMDEIFGRANYVVTLYIQVRYAEKTLKQDMAFHKQVEQIHVYRRQHGAAPNQKSQDISFDKFRCHIHVSGKGRELTLGGKSVTVFGAGEWTLERGKGSADGLKEIWASGSILDGNSSGRFFRDHLSGRVTQDGLGALYKVGGIGEDGLGYRYLSGPARAGATKGKYYQGVPLGRLGADAKPHTSPIGNFYDLAAHFGNCRHEGGVEFRSGKKPEALLEIILTHFSSPGDLVLDAFGGSGSTGAAAHKMGRRWIMIEQGEHCRTHIAARLRKVIDGADPGGITKSADWRGGGGFRYFHLAPA